MAKYDGKHGRLSAPFITNDAARFSNNPFEGYVGPLKHVDVAVTLEEAGKLELDDVINSLVAMLQ